MPAMTPIKSILIVGPTVYYVDYANQLNLAAALPAGSEKEAILAASALASYHNKYEEIYFLELAIMQVVKLDLKEKEEDSSVQAKQENPFGPKEK